MLKVFVQYFYLSHLSMLGIFFQVYGILVVVVIIYSLATVTRAVTRKGHFIVRSSEDNLSLYPRVEV